MYLRVLCSLLLLTAVSSHITHTNVVITPQVLQDIYLERANRLIAKQTNLTAVKICLLKSYVLYSNAEAAFILGKMYLFGVDWPQSSDSSIVPVECEGTADVAYHTKYRLYLTDLEEELAANCSSPNFIRAYTYFSASYMLGHKDAGVFIYYLYMQTQIMLPLNQSFPMINHQFAIQAYNTARLRGSSLANVIYVNKIFTCNRLAKTHTAETAELKHKGELPILTPKDVFPQSAQIFGEFAQGFDIATGQCPSCAIGLMNLVPILTEVMKSVEKLGGFKVKPPRLDVFHHEVMKDKKGFDMDLTAALQILKEKAERGNAIAQVALGDSYFFGNPESGIERNLTTAQKYYEMAAKQNNNAHAQNALGIMALQGIGVQQNATEAMQYFIQAAKSGDVSAMNSLAYAYLLGNNGKQNSTLAVEWLEKAASLNHTESEANLGSLLKSGLYGVKKDEKKALIYTIRAAKKGQILSILNLALFYIEKQSDKNFHIGIPCWEIMRMALEVISKGDFLDYELQAFNAYKEKQFEKAYVGYSFGAMLGMSDSIYASAYLWEKKRMESFQCKGGKPNRCALGYHYQLYLLRNDEHLTTMADLIYADTHAASSAAFTRAFKLYNYSSILNNDPRALHSFAWMAESGIGTEKNQTAALEGYRKLVTGYLSGQYKISAFVAGAVQLARLKIWEFFSQFVN